MPEKYDAGCRLYNLYAVDSDMMNKREVVPWPAQGSRNGTYSAGSLN